MAQTNDDRISILPSLSALRSVEGLSVLSWNVLLPNSQDGWWVYKYYGSNVPREDSAWPAREALFRRYFEEADADVICIQEASGESFESDFAFMKDLGYECELHQKYRLRSATFWKRDKLQLVEAFHKDRVLITCLAGSEGSGRDTSAEFFIANCHLSAGKDPRRRFGQVEQALDQVRKGVNKHRKAMGNSPASEEDFRAVPVVVCGDFNSEATEAGSQTAWRALMSTGAVDEGFREAAYPEAPITSKTKTQVFGKFIDTYGAAFQNEQSRISGEGSSGVEAPARGIPATYVAASLDSKFLVNGFEQRRNGGELTMTPEFIEALKRMFLRFAGGCNDDEPGTPDVESMRLDKAAVDKWLVTINGEVGRGSEYRTAAELMERNKDQFLSLSELREVYERELRDGKYWGVQHDLGACGVDFQMAPSSGRKEAPYEGVLDGIHVNSGAWEVAAVVEPLPEARRADVYELSDFPPNAWCPSDHFPVAAVIRHRK